MFEDKTLVCKDCGEEFVFTAREQEFYESKGFVNEPQRCKPCRDKRKNAGRAPREMHDEGRRKRRSCRERRVIILWCACRKNRHALLRECRSLENYGFSDRTPYSC